jgi:hypothetical protein
VDATEHKELGERYGVQGFPTLKWFKGGKPVEYGGGREEKTIVSWVRKRIGAATTTVSSAAELAAFTAKNPVAGIAYVSAADSALAKAVGDAAQANDDVPYAITTSAEVSRREEKGGGGRGGGGGVGEGWAQRSAAVPTCGCSGSRRALHTPTPFSRTPALLRLFFSCAPPRAWRRTRWWPSTTLRARRTRCVEREERVQNDGTQRRRICCCRRAPASTHQRSRRRPCPAAALAPALPPQITYTGAVDAAAIGTFVSSHSLPAVVLFTQESAPRIFRGPLRTHFLLFANAVNESSVAATAAFRASALANRGAALYVRVDPSEERITQYFGVSEADMPTAVLGACPGPREGGRREAERGDCGGRSRVRACGGGGWSHAHLYHFHPPAYFRSPLAVSMPEASAMKKFGWPKGTPLTTEAFNAQIAGWKAGTLKPTLKSEPVPDAAAEAAAAVKTVVVRAAAAVVAAGWGRRGATTERSEGIDRRLCSPAFCALFLLPVRACAVGRLVCGRGAGLYEGRAARSVRAV